jgi:hypothetical protein
MRETKPMLRIILLAAFAACGFAQNAADLLNRPPEGVDKTLRARITEFYDYHIHGPVRKAESLVAEDTKDFFYVNNKPAYTHCDIRHIDYFDDYTRAKATVVCGMFVLVPGFTDKPLDVPIPSTWKIEEGKWVWYVDQDTRQATPFGKMKPGPPSASAAPGAPPSLPSIPTNTDFLNDLVKVDKRDVNLKRGQSAQLTITNSAPGTMNLEIVGKIAGVEAKLDSTTLKANEKAVLTVKAGEGAQSGSLQIAVLPISQMIPIQVTVK